MTSSTPKSTEVETSVSNGIDVEKEFKALVSANLVCSVFSHLGTYAPTIENAQQLATYTAKIICTMEKNLGKTIDDKESAAKAILSTKEFVSLLPETASSIVSEVISEDNHDFFGFLSHQVSELNFVSNLQPQKKTKSKGCMC